jgi:hypothetical protein
VSIYGLRLRHFFVRSTKSGTIERCTEPERAFESPLPFPPEAMIRKPADTGHPRKGTVRTRTLGTVRTRTVPNAIQPRLQVGCPATGGHGPVLERSRSPQACSTSVVRLTRLRRIALHQPRLLRDLRLPLFLGQRRQHLPGVLGALPSSFSLDRRKRPGVKKCGDFELDRLKEESGRRVAI